VATEPVLGDAEREALLAVERAFAT
jgi:hypothetical protein